MGGVECTMVSGRATSSTSCVAVARSPARKCVAETCARHVELDAEPASRRRRASSSQRTPVRPPVSCGRMYGNAWSATVDRHRPTRPPRWRSGYVSCGPLAEPARACSRPGDELEHRPDARQVGQLGRELDRLVDTDRRRPRARVRRCSCADLGSRIAGRELADDGRARPVAIDRVERRRSRRSTPQPLHRSAASPAIRSLSVGARHRASGGGAANAGCTRWPASSTAPRQRRSGSDDRAAARPAGRAR